MAKSTTEKKGLAVNFLQGLLGTDFSPKQVAKNKEQYNSKYANIAKAYGFANFKDMFDYCMNDDNALDFIAKATAVNQGAISATGNKSKEKDTSDLVLATKTGTRNGKPYTSQYWVDPSKSKQTNISNGSKDNDNAISIIPDGLYLGGDKFGKPFETTINNSKTPDSWVSVGKFKPKCFDYIYTIENDNITLMSGLTLKNKIVTIQFVSAYSREQLLGNIFKLISKVMKESWIANYGVEFDTKMFQKYITIIPLCKQFQLTKKGDLYRATPKQLQKILGDSSWYRL